jgi:hypothetical protein
MKNLETINGINTALINGAVGAIEVRCKQPKADALEFTAAAQISSPGLVKLVVLSHPHPLYGGTMNNKVITTLERTFLSLGYITVAYNFRGVGQSSGLHDHGAGEQDDLAAVLSWASQRFKAEHIVLAGFSFGSYVTLQALNQAWLNDYKPFIKGICTVAPPVGLYDFNGLHVQDVPWVVIQGGQDEVVSAQGILNWIMSASAPQTADVYWRGTASHFFHGELVWLKNTVLGIYG